MNESELGGPDLPPDDGYEYDANECSSVRYRGIYYAKEYGSEGLGRGIRVSF